jgi:hypothetical protein
MIKLSIDHKTIGNINKEITNKINGIAEINKPEILDKIAQVAFEITGNSFVKAVDRYAVRNAKSMHHIYEWGQMGNPAARLFEIKRSPIINGRTAISSNFKISKTPVPIDPSLLIPGKTGKYVTSKNIFKNKAAVMEAGLPISYTAQKMLAFAGKQGNVFLRPGTIVNIKNPGGIATKNAFSKFMLEWYNLNIESIMQESGIYERIANEASTTLNKNGAGAQELKSSVQQAIVSMSSGRSVIN